jgi:hypothetical protein
MGDELGYGDADLQLGVLEAERVLKFGQVIVWKSVMRRLARRLPRVSLDEIRALS